MRRGRRGINTLLKYGKKDVLTSVVSDEVRKGIGGKCSASWFRVLSFWF